MLDPSPWTYMASIQHYCTYKTPDIKWLWWLKESACIRLSPAVVNYMHWHARTQRCTNAHTHTNHTQANNHFCNLFSQWQNNTQVYLCTENEYSPVCLVITATNNFQQIHRRAKKCNNFGINQNTYVTSLLLVKIQWYHISPWHIAHKLVPNAHNMHFKWS